MNINSLLHAQVFTRVSFLDKMFFTKHLSVMLKSGIPLEEAIATLRDQTKSPTFKHVLTKVLQDVQNGQSLKNAFSKHPDIFDSMYLSLIEIGEESGNLEEDLEYLSIQLRKNYEFKKKVQGAMLYPIIVLVATVVIGMSLALFVLPKLTDLFTSLEVELPITTQILLFVANTMKVYGVFITIALVIGFLAISALLKTPYFKPKWHQFLLTLPIFGPLLQDIELTSICRSLGIMLKSGLPITTALKTEERAAGNLVYKYYLQELIEAQDKGKRLSIELSSPKYKFIPTLVPKMIEVGEKTGKLEESFAYLGDFFEEEVDDVTKNLATTLEPILLLVIGAVVAFVALAIISPIYQLTGSIKR